MKKFFLKLGLALLPIVAYVAFFIAFEPNNYFGLHTGANADDSVIAKIRSFEQDGATRIILGDSRMAHFDADAVQAAAGAPFANLAFGGASLEESIDLFYFAFAQNPKLEQVVFGFTFYTLNTNYGSVNRMATIQTQLQNPLAYIFNLEYNINTLQNFVYKVQGVQTGGADETAVWGPADYLDSTTGSALPYRANLIRYAASLYGNCAQPGTLDGAQTETQLAAAMLATNASASKFTVNEEQLNRLLEMAALCEREGIYLSIVLPPISESVRELVCEPLGIDLAMAPALAALHSIQSEYVQVLDYEWENPPAFEDAQFFDGFHIDTVYGLPAFTEMLFNEVANGA
ncbi:hypothetical protein LJB77_00405 [Ruminococcaceae bacterium OttesenSCG-928-N02]|nr:hypothetical protein [Ruminococcaceae bacterium OttesenSCG-928-N02]